MIDRNLLLSGDLRENRGGHWMNTRHWELWDDGEISHLKGRRRSKKSLAESRACSNASLSSDPGVSSGQQRVRYWLQSGCAVSQLEVVETESRRKRKRMYAFALTWPTSGGDEEEEECPLDEGLDDAIISPPGSPTAAIDSGRNQRNVVSEHLTPNNSSITKYTPCSRRQRKTGKSIATMGAAGLFIGLGGAAIGVVTMGVGLVPYIMACTVALGGGGALTRHSGKNANRGVLVLGTDDENIARSWREACLQQVQAANAVIRRDSYIAPPSELKGHSSQIPFEGLTASLFFRKLCIRKWRGAATGASFAAARTFIPYAKPAAVLDALLQGSSLNSLDGLIDRIEQLEPGAIQGEDLGLLGCRALAPKPTSLILLLQAFFSWLSALFMATYFNDPIDIQKSRDEFIQFMWYSWALWASIVRFVMKMLPGMSLARWALTTSHLRPRHFVVRRKWRQLDKGTERDEAIERIQNSSTFNESEDTYGYALELTSAHSSGSTEHDHWCRLTGSRVKLHDASLDAVFLLRSAADHGCVLDLALRVDAPKRTRSILSRPRMPRGITSAFRNSVAELYLNEFVAACLLDLPKHINCTSNTDSFSTTLSVNALKERIKRTEAKIANEPDTLARREQTRALASDIALLRRFTDGNQCPNSGIDDDEDSPQPVFKDDRDVLRASSSSEDAWRLMPVVFPDAGSDSPSHRTVLALEALLYLTVVALVTFVALKKLAA
mmetsp:Transcript_4730/g.6702  ORF Transcript_4730/g.6702 Transcript_4730/m.6702 type:complete len:724 (+) Transcript_4730:173-2344(+)|eukprot:CAMPEP_0197300528 /NCGR_PEP_ID=MMETSP0890-20130614/48597_1 /TAXON_ID=44058 ORGANISM="Aureoumbra lagunensis, Strain CCMP1510" /NCGR_SAMPLE_ID=MMETSP0890 /ASSEMBLY_ACC=CAM_ASM_000533 /LENGTH=723 /DNA_ID=CAMNT_0042779429 /DNA_START=84 /DNA_END=2255 /DNA_ORIENTATION=-